MPKGIGYGSNALNGPVKTAAVTKSGKKVLPSKTPSQNQPRRELSMDELSDREHPTRRS